jgi:HSP20 family molecular chaperone IbpA
MPFFLTGFHTLNLGDFTPEALQPIDRLPHTARRHPCPLPPGSQQPPFCPKFDVREVPTAYILEGEFPGIDDTAELCIEFTDAATLLIHGSLQRVVPGLETEGEDRGTYLIMERSAGEFRRRCWFQDGIDVDGVDARLGNGILRVYVPKKER